MKIGIVGGGPGGLALAHALLTLPGPKAIDSVTIYDRHGRRRPQARRWRRLSALLRRGDAQAPWY